MGRPITRSYIIDLLDQFYINQENNCYFVWSYVVLQLNLLKNKR